MATAAVTGYRDVSESAASIQGEVEDPQFTLSGREVAGKEVPAQETVSQSITTRQKLILAACSCSSCFMHMGVSTIPLLLPPEIIRKGIPYEYCGMIFSLFATAIVIFEPLQAKLLPMIGTKRAFCFSALLGGFCYISFGMLTFAYSTAGFAAPAMIIRFVEGFYYAVLITSSNVIVCLEFPDHASLAFGILEGFVGAGFTLGPLVGGSLFAAGGFIAPFLFIGLALLATSLFGYFVLDQVTGLNLQSRPREKKRLIRDPIFIALGMLTFTMGIVWGIFETSLEPYLATYDQGPIVEGVVFAIAYLAYAGMSPVWGYVFRRVHIDYRWVLVGPVCVGVIWMILGPIPMLSFIGTDVLWLDVVCLFLLNVSIAFVFVFSYDTMLKRAVMHGLEENVATYALIVAAFFSSIYIGEIIGPVIGGYVYAKLSFQYVALVASSAAPTEWPYCRHDYADQLESPRTAI
ncbi:putative MFS-type transporter SLC18B1 [Hypsibius exemplaris]|uniref:MFS-type transporter SLC18B1 n=1 Tax=Hypsibius exemplaris TaxID=2072580 RepID=A0A1W0X3W9_HYPEX|nr:putative MFS-type transporter SLC18B1 [Hypsibius exemplaris]